MAARALQRPVQFAEEVRLLAHARDPALLLDREGTVLFVNEAWDRFARENGGGERVASSSLVGTRWFDHISGEAPRRLHRLLFERAVRRLGPAAFGGVVQINEANGPETARLVATHLEPVIGPGDVLTAVAVIHRVVREVPLAEVYPVVTGDEERWRAEDGLVEQCSCCRRVRRPEEPAEWDLVPGLVAEPPADVRFGYCALCLELHYAAGAGVEHEDP
jgi:PAS domain-containing protein